MSAFAFLLALAVCPSPAESWIVLRGELAPGRSCGALVATTDATRSRVYLGGAFRPYSLGRFARREPVRAPFELAIEWQHLTPGRWSFEVEVLGARIVIGDTAFSFFIDEAQHAGELLQDAGNIGGPGLHHLVIRQTEREIQVFSEGRLVGRRQVAAPKSGAVGIGLRGPAGHRGQVEVRSFVLRPL